MTQLLFKVLLIWINHIIFGFGEMNPSKSTVECIVQAVRLIARHKIALEFTEDSEELASKILEKINTPVILNTPEHRRPFKRERRAPVDVLLLLKQAKPAKILTDTLWNGNTRFIVVTQNEQAAERYFEDFWKLKVINVFGMVMAEGNISLYSFLPYGRKNCTKAELIIVDSCLEGKLQNGGTALKDLMRIKNMHQCPVNVTISEIRPSLIFRPKEGWKNSTTVAGYEGNFIMEVAKVYNFNATYKISDDGIHFGWIVPSPRGAIRDVFIGISDITVGNLGPFMDRYEYLDLATNYNNDECVTFGLPRGYRPKRAAWLTDFVLEFTIPMWSLIMLSFVITTINVWVINRYSNGNWLRSKTEIVLSLFSICLGVPIRSPHVLSGRISFLFWVVYTFIITVGYRASMGSLLAVPPRDADLDTFEDLLQSDLQLIGLKNNIQMMNHSDWPFNELKRRYKYSNESVHHSIHRIADGDKIASLYSRSSFFYFSLQSPHTWGQVHFMKECVYSFRPQPMLKKFSPFTRKVSQVVRRLEESGIMKMWRAEYKKDFHSAKKPLFKVSMEQMLGVFCFLLVGYGFAFFSFLWEVVYNQDVRKPVAVLLPMGFNRREIAPKDRACNDVGGFPITWRNM